MRGVPDRHLLPVLSSGRLVSSAPLAYEAERALSFSSPLGPALESLFLGVSFLPALCGTQKPCHPPVSQSRRGAVAWRNREGWASGVPQCQLGLGTFQT